MTNRALSNPFPWAAEYQYAQSVLTDGELVFTAGQGGFGDDGTVVSDDPEAQIRQAFANVDLALQAGGARSTFAKAWRIWASGSSLKMVPSSPKPPWPAVNTSSPSVSTDCAYWYSAAQGKGLGRARLVIRRSYPEIN